MAENSADIKKDEKTALTAREGLSKGLKETKPIFDAIENMGVKAFKEITTAVQAAGKSVVDIGGWAAEGGMAFEEAFAGVKNHTQATAKEYEELRRGIMNMTREIPVAGDEIAALAQTAGTLGIKKDHLLDFTSVMLNMGKTTDLSASEAAGQLRTLAKLTDMNADDYSRLGSAVVELGNHFEVSEAGIVKMAIQLADSGEMAEYSQAQILATAAAMTDMGMEAEAGSASMSSLVKNIQAVETPSGDLMSEALERSNSAWEENTALAAEAGTSYETTESKMAIMKNGFLEMGIEIYDQFNGPLRESIGVITELIQAATGEIAGSSFIRDLANEIKSGAPSVLRQTKEMGKAIYEFAEPLIYVGKWMAENPTIIMSTIAGIGSAIVTYKVAEGIIGVADAVTALTTASAPVLAVMGVVAAISAITVAVKCSAQEAKKANLEEHFGNISLSMEELNSVAKALVYGDTFGQVEEALAAFGSLSGLEEGIKETIRSLDLMNWKVSIGLELTQEEAAAYQANIQQYISDTIGYFEAQQYSVNIAVGMLTGNDLENSNIVKDINQFYSGKYEELGDLGEELNKALTDAFQDGLLEFDEVEKIIAIQEKMAKIQAAISGNEFDAGMSMIKGNYAGIELTSDSFLDLLSVLGTETEKGKEGNDKAYKSVYSANSAMLENYEIDEEEFNQRDHYFQASRLVNNSKIDTTAITFATDTIMETYGEDINKIGDLLGEGLSNYNLTENSWGVVNPGILKNNIKEDIGNKHTQAALAELWVGFKDNFESLLQQKEQLAQLGVEAPEGLKEAIYRTAKIGAAAGDETAIFTFLASMADENPYYMEQLKAMEDEGVLFPEMFTELLNDQDLEPFELLQKQAEGREEVLDIDVNTRYHLQSVANTGAGSIFGLESYDAIKSNLEEKAAEGIDIEVYVRYHLQSIVVSAVGAVLSAETTKKRADGGIITEPEVALIAEAGYPEAVIPINGSQNAVSLWQQAGEMLGVYKKKKGISDYVTELAEGVGGISNLEESNKFTFSPVYQFHGEAPSRKDLDHHVRASFEEWETMMNRWMRNNQRFSFS